ncbi:patatin-like phospholipase family protein [Amycolatopsis sp., V23-08]|uniref:Patatin-like phospholipase family protein n=1 Tax=Amycolatopsis heterodermiae TaxID=3110235 RepID=A0ABU5RG99_9PSEU|nr:patatin-like phospholipase family protein [Amycolatopsis sp., V23-08]MEA5364599.1 patatin-like phospholipase family protein [Amycolatopsis sp., V23-08]
MSFADLPRPIGFVLGGGGSLGAMQVGMLRAVAEAGITPDLAVGTSVGSLNAAVLALTHDDPIERLRGIWAHMTRDEAFPGGVLSRVRTLTQSKTHLFPNSGLTRIINEHVGADRRFEDLALPLGVVTTQVDTAEPLLIRSGPLLEPLLASCAIPGIFPPVSYEGRLLYDGGLVANVPMRQALAMGAQSLVVFDCAFPGKLPSAPRTFAEVMMFTAMISMRNQAVLEAPLAASQVPVVYLPGPAPSRVNPLDFGHTDALAAEAYDAAKEFLEGIAVSGAGLYGAPGLVVT